MCLPGREVGLTRGWGSVARLVRVLQGASNRRDMLLGITRITCGLSLAGAGLALYAHKSAGLPPAALRPPGALAGSDFLAACVRCGLCVRDCPYDTLQLAGLLDAVATGTPYFTARAVPCEMCDDIPCVAACPTAALDPSLTDINAARMGLATLVDQENCLNFQGLRCDVCYRVCPLLDEAITLEIQHDARSGKHAKFIPTVHSEKCTGCGKCEHACVLPEAANQGPATRARQGCARRSLSSRLGGKSKIRPQFGRAWRNTRVPLTSRLGLRASRPWLDRTR